MGAASLETDKGRRQKTVLCRVSCFSYSGNAASGANCLIQNIKRHSCLKRDETKSTSFFPRSPNRHEKSIFFSHQLVSATLVALGGCRTLCRRLCVAARRWMAGSVPRESGKQLFCLWLSQTNAGGLPCPRESQLGSRDCRPRST